VLERQVSNADGPANLGQKDRAAVRQERGERQVVVARVADLLSLPGGGGAAELPAGRDVPDAYGSLLEVGAERQPTIRREAGGLDSRIIEPPEQSVVEVQVRLRTGLEQWPKQDAVAPGRGEEPGIRGECDRPLAAEEQRPRVLAGATRAFRLRWRSTVGSARSACPTKTIPA
jgi:hypothetical protein